MKEVVAGRAHSEYTQPDEGSIRIQEIRRAGSNEQQELSNPVNSYIGAFLPRVALYPRHRFEPQPCARCEGQEHDTTLWGFHCSSPKPHCQSRASKWQRENITAPKGKNKLPISI